MIESTNVQFHWGIKVPLRDGIHLSATVYTPRDQPGPLPCVLTLTPYIGDHYHERGLYFASHGMPFVVVDVRGRGNSDGVFQPFIQEGKDGYDVVEWLARQPYCDGKVAMRGGSYCAYTQWATAKEFPPHLATIVPTASPCIGMDFPMRNNIWHPYLMQWLTFVSGRSSQSQIFHDRAFWAGIYRQWFESGRPFRDVDNVLGNPSPIFQEWLTHPEPDGYWDACNLSAQEYARLHAPVLTITGSYDDDQPGALEHYQRHLRHGSPAARARHYLIIGPWDHAGTGTPKAEFGGMKFGAASLVDLWKLHLEWYAWTLQGGSRPEFLKKQVAWYVMGAERWRYADTLAEVTAWQQPWFLDSAANAHDVFCSGSLGTAPAKGEPDWYTYDPRDVHGLEVDAEARSDGESLVDQSGMLALCGRQLVYHSSPFERDTEISGFFRLCAWIAIDCPDTDFYVSVHEICLDGSSIRLSTDAIRARYRGGLRASMLVHTDAPLLYTFDRFTFVSRQMKRGHRLRLVIAPTGRLLGMSFTQKNYNAGGVVAEESAKDGRAVTVKLFHDESHPSVLYVPLGRTED